MFKRKYGIWVRVLFLFFWNACIHNCYTFLDKYTNNPHTQLLSADIGQQHANWMSMALDHRPGCPERTPGPCGICELREWERGKGKGGREMEQRWWLWEKCTWHTDKSQSLEEDVTDSVSAVSGLCQLSVTVSPFSLYISFNLGQSRAVPAPCSVLPFLVGRRKHTLRPWTPRSSKWKKENLIYLLSVRSSIVRSSQLSPRPCPLHLWHSNIMTMSKLRDDPHFLLSLNHFCRCLRFKVALVCYVWGQGDKISRQTYQSLLYSCTTEQTLVFISSTKSTRGKTDSQFV